MLSVKRLSTCKELGSFAEDYLAVSGILVESEYLAGSEVFGAFDRLGNLSGGFVVREGRPERTFSVFVSPGRLQEIETALGSDSLLEVTCLWLSPQYRGTITSTLFWFSLGAKLNERAHATIVCGTVVPSLHRFYSSNGAQLIAEDIVTAGGVTKKSWILSLPARGFLKRVARGAVTRTWSAALTSAKRKPRTPSAA